MLPPPVTVGIPAIGRIHFLREAIISLREQSFTDWTGIISDDSNSEDVRALVTSFNDSRLSYIGRSAPLGLFGNFNFLLQSAASEFCGILHDDDRYHRDYLAMMLEGMRTHANVRWAFCNAWRVVEETQERCRWISTTETGVYPAGGRLLARLARGCCICCPTVLLHREVYTTLRFNTAYTYSSDWEAWLKLAGQYDAFFLAEPMLYSREWSGSTTSSCHRACIHLSEDLRIYQWLRNLPEMAALHREVDGRIHNRVDKLCWRIISMSSEEEVQGHLPLLKEHRGALVTLATLLARHPRLRSMARVAVRAYERRRERYDRAKVRESVVGAL